MMKYLRHPRVAKLSMVLIVILTAGEYARWAYSSSAHAESIVAGVVEKPYVYRALVHWVARPLVYMGLPADAALTIVIVLSAVGLLYGLYYLIRSFRQ